MNDIPVFSMMLFVGSVFIASISQILLKISADKKDHKNIVREYLNPYVASAYGIFIVSTLLTAFAYRHIQLSQGLVLESLSFVFIALLSRAVLKEKISRRKIMGICLIIAGIAIYTAF